MKKYFIYAVTLLLSLSFFSCKDEDDMAELGTGGPLTGLWFRADSETLEATVMEDNSLTGINVTYDGRLQPIEYRNNTINLTSDRSLAIFKSFSGNEFTLKTLNGEGKGTYQFDTIIKLVTNHYEPVVCMSLSSTLLSAKSDELPADNVVAGQTFVKLYEFSGESNRPTLARDAALLGDWAQQSGTMTLSFGANAGALNGYTLSDWCTNKGMLYIVQPFTIGTFTTYIEQQFSYSVVNGVLTTYNSSTGTRTFVRGTIPSVPDTPDTPDVPDTPDTPDTPDVPDTPDIPDTPDVPEQPTVVGNPGELAGAWMRLTDDKMYHSLSGGNKYGFVINADGTCQYATVSSASSLSSGNLLLTFTSASDGKYTAVTPDGREVSGTYENRLIVTFTDVTTVVYDRLDILTCSYTFSVGDAKSFVGSYARAKNPDGSDYVNVSLRYELAKTWYHDYLNGDYFCMESFDLEILGFGSYTNYCQDSRDEVRWGVYQENGKDYIMFYYPSNGNYISYQYTLISGSLYINVQGEWLIFTENPEG